MQLSRTPQGTGMFPQLWSDVPMWIRGGSALAGDLYMQDFYASDGATSTAGPTSLGTTTSIWSNVVPPSNTDNGLEVECGGPAFCVAQKAVADDTTALCTFHGFVEAFVLRSSGNVAIGDHLFPDTNKNLQSAATTTAFAKIIGMAQEALTAPSTRTLSDVFINGLGWCGMGFYHA